MRHPEGRHIFVIGNVLGCVSSLICNPIVAIVNITFRYWLSQSHPVPIVYHQVRSLTHSLLLRPLTYSLNHLLT